MEATPSGHSALEVIVPVIVAWSYTLVNILSVVFLCWHVQDELWTPLRSICYLTFGAPRSVCCCCRDYPFCWWSFPQLAEHCSFFRSSWSCRGSFSTNCECSRWLFPLLIGESPYIGVGWISLSTSISRLQASLLYWEFGANFLEPACLPAGINLFTAFLMRIQSLRFLWASGRRLHHNQSRWYE